MNHEQSVTSMCGPYSAIFTPFDASNEVNFDALSEIATYQLNHGIQGFFATGSTGEGLLLSYDERLAVIKFLVENFSERATIIAHVGHPSTEFATKLAIDSAAVGADWISSVTPIYHGTNFEGMLRHYTSISNATDLPFMMYSLHGVVDSHRDVALFELPNVCGLKYTGANFYSVQQLVRRVERPVALMSGFDEQFIAGQSFGFSGGIGSTFNFGPQFYSGIYNNYRQGDIAAAAALQAKINMVTDLMVEYENWSYRKAIMRYLGFDCGHCRAPYAPLTEAEYAAFAIRLDALGVLDRANEQAQTQSQAT